MKVVNIYNQTFIGNSPTDYNWEFTILPYIVKSRHQNKWRITVCNCSLIDDDAPSVSKTYQLWSSNLGDGKQTSQTTTQDSNTTALLIGVLGNYVNSISMCLANTSAPMIYMVDNLSKSPFNVYYTYVGSGIQTIPLNISFTLRIEELEY